MRTTSYGEFAVDHSYDLPLSIDRIVYRFGDGYQGFGNGGGGSIQGPCLASEEP